jgi:hypothetical protein
MKKISIKKIAFVISIVLVTGLSTYALANMGFGSHTGGNGGSGYHMNSSEGYNHMVGNNGNNMGYGQHMNYGNHMAKSGHMGNGMYNDGHMFNSGYGQDHNKMFDDMNRMDDYSIQKYSDENSELEKDEK